MTTPNPVTHSEVENRDQVIEQMNDSDTGDLDEYEPDDSLNIQANVCGADVEKSNGGHAQKTVDIVISAPEGGSPTWAKCDHGCEASQSGGDDHCKAVPINGCAERYRQYTQWTCSTSGNLFRCHDGNFERKQCRRGCRALHGRVDRCKWL